MGQPASADGATVLGIPDPPLDVDEPMTRAFDATVARLALTFRHPSRSDRPTARGDAEPRTGSSNTTKAARVHEARYREFGDRLLDVAEMVREGLQIPRDQYEAALASIDECRAIVAEHLEATPVIVTPAATGPAPVRDLDRRVTRE